MVLVSAAPSASADACSVPAFAPQAAVVAAAVSRAARAIHVRMTFLASVKMWLTLTADE
jgi:hypothetical protein